MSENKPNDEPKLSTTDRVVKCKCTPVLCECVSDGGAYVGVEGRTLGGSCGRRESVFRRFRGGGGRRVLAERS